MLPDPANRVSRRAIWHWMVRYALMVVALAALTLTPALLLPLNRTSRHWSVLSVTVVLCAAVALAVLLPLWQYSVHRWETVEGFILTRSGAVFRDWRIVPLNRVQTVEVSQGMLERAFGVARLVVRTASYAGSTEISGLDATRARKLADSLTAALSGSVDDGA